MQKPVRRAAKRKTLYVMRQVTVFDPSITPARQAKLIRERSSRSEGGR